MQVMPQYSCYKGGDPFLACKWLEYDNNKIKLEKCWPYSIIEDPSLYGGDKQWVSPDKLPENCCSTCCDKKTINAINQKFSIKLASTKSLAIVSNRKINKNATIAAIQREIMVYGPVITCFKVYDDFMKYWKYGAPKKQIYISDNKGESGGHAVTITGWGVKTLNGKKIRYWELRNSWGTINSGDGGYGYIAFSTDVPANANIQIDIPQEYSTDPNTGEIQWSGGMFTLSPGPLPPTPKNLFNKFTTGSSNTDSTPSGSSIKIFGIKIQLYTVIIILVLLLTLFTYLGYMLLKKK